MTSARRELDMEYLEPGDVVEKLALPEGLKATAINVGRKPRIVKDGDAFVLKLNNKAELPLLTVEGRDSLFQYAGIPKGLANSTPEKLLMPVLEHHLGSHDKVTAISDETNGLLRLTPSELLAPTIAADVVMEQLLDQFPEVQYQQAQVTDNYGCDLLAITHNDTEKLEELLQPDLHKFLPRGGDPFKSGVHVRFSPVGTTAPKIEPYMVRLVCRNGAVHAEYLSQWGKGYGEGDELWQWFREGLQYADNSVRDIMGQYTGLVGEELPRNGEERMRAVEGMIHNARLPRAQADAIRDMAIAHQPRTMYDIWNMMTAAATHTTKSFGEQLQRMTVAASHSHPDQHGGYCPTCRRN